MKAILFDLDGTLLPMDEDLFVKGYFSLLAKRLCPLGVEPKALIGAVWEGTACMMKNDGSDTNKNVFWKKFGEILGVETERFIEESDDFYLSDFQAAKAYTEENPLAKEAVGIAREKSGKVCLATNPIFPLEAQKARMGWIGLNAADFDLITPYESEVFAKPNPMYFKSICERLGVEPVDVLMVGNNEEEDMYAARLAGLDTFLVTDWRKNSEKHPYEGKSGTFEEMVEYLKAL